MAGNGSLDKVTLLIVDDSLHIRRLVKTMLRAMGAHYVHEAKDINTALDILTAKPVDLVLTDWMLEDSTANTGMELVREIRRSPIDRVAFVPVLMMTGHTERDNIERARDAGVNELLAKPFTAQTLAQRISALIENPRPFVRTRAYFGPDRRRRHDGPGNDGERRFIVPTVQRES